MMLSQFRLCYPHGSLISELVQIDHGKYIVRALVQVEGVTLSTGLAAADTVEQAEDNARARALALLDLKTPTTSPLRQESRDSASPPDRQPSAPATQAENDFLPRSARGDRAPAPVAHPPEPAPLPEPLAISLRAVPEAIARPTLTLVPEPVPAVAQAVTQTATVLSEELPSEPSPEPSEVKGENGEQETENSGSETVVLGTASEAQLTPTTTEDPLDFSDIIAKSNVELKRLRWTNEQGRNYLLQTYGKRSRQLLSDEELLEFLNYLSSLPTPAS